MVRELIVVGGGEHARAVIDAARSRADEWNVLGFVDDAPCEESVRCGIPRLGDDARGIQLAASGGLFALGVGSVKASPARSRVVDRYRAIGDRWAIIVHQRAWISPAAKLQPGCVVMAGAIVNAGAEVGAHCVINSGAIVEHDCKLGAFVQLAPGAVVGGGSSVGAGSFLGLGSRVRDHIQIGRDTLVGMGAVVTSSIGDSQVAIGIPARVLPAHG